MIFGEDYKRINYKCPKCNSRRYMYLMVKDARKPGAFNTKCLNCGSYYNIKDILAEVIKK